LAGILNVTQITPNDSAAMPPCDGSIKIVTATAEHLLITTKPSRIDAAYGCQRPEKPEVDHGSTSQVGHRADQCEATEVETYPRTFFSYLVEETYKITV
jgi:hypothetical protein